MGYKVVYTMYMVNETQTQENDMRLKKGDRVKTVYGKTETVMKVGESVIVTYESYRRLEWYHPTKVWKR